MDNPNEFPYKGEKSKTVLEYERLVDHPPNRRMDLGDLWDEAERRTKDKH